MRLERVDVLKQGTPVCQIESGYKECANPGNHPAYHFDGRLICPGCKRLCKLPGMIAAGNRFIVRKRPKEQREDHGAQ